MTSKLPLSQKIGYGIGDIGSNIFIVSTGMFLLFYLTNILGIEPALAGLALLVPKLWDVISDPIMGAISDVTRSRWGRRRPYLLAASIPFGVVFYFLFAAPNTQSDLATVVLVGFLFALSCTVFTIYNIPYSAMVAEMTDDYNERMSVTSFRMVGSSIGVLLAGGLAMPLVDYGGGGITGFRLMGLLLGVLITLFCLAGFWGTRGVKTIVAVKPKIALAEQIKIAFKNTPFKLIMSMYAIQSLAIGVLMAGQIYYVKYVMGMPDASVGLVSAVLFITAIAFIPVWVRVGVKLGKIAAYKIGIGILTLMLFSLLFTQPEQELLFFIQMFLLGIGFSSFQLFPFSMLPDTIEFDELQSKLRREGIFSGIWASGQKTAYAVGPSLIGFTLSLSGFALGAEQPASVVTGIRLIFCVFTALLFLLSLIPFKAYDLTETRFAEIKARIKSE